MGEEYSPPAYHALELPSYLLTVRQVLFGTEPDWLMRNYRVFQLMSMLHATELEEFVLDLDPRITYETGTNHRPFDSVFPFRPGLTGTVELEKIPGTTKELFASGNFEPPDLSGKCYHQWRVCVSTSSAVELVHQTRPRKSATEEYTITNGLSSLVPLPEAPTQVRFEEGTGSEWRVKSYARPQRSLGDLEAAMEGVGEDVILELFAVGSTAGATEPYTTFKNLWEDHHESAYRLGAIVLGLIYRTEAVRNVG